MGKEKRNTNTQGKKRTPEWGKYQSHIISGKVKKNPKATAIERTSPKSMDAKNYADGVLSGNRTTLSRAITLVESNAARHFHLAQELLQKILPHTGKSIRIGITGVPGAGKSSFIDSLGFMLCHSGHKVAVLAVDPTSSVTKGSILGDKTRMEKLSMEPNAFIRPSPSGGVLGGVARKTRETILLCEATGFDVILIETVGIGQSEVSVRGMVDFFLLLTITGAGDELQGIKKGVIELSDAIVVHKADGDNRKKALQTMSELNQALHYLAPTSSAWNTKTLIASSLTGEGIEEAWNLIRKYQSIMVSTGNFAKKRQEQSLEWVEFLVNQMIQRSFLENPSVKQKYNSLKKKLLQEEIPPTLAAETLVNTFFSNLKERD